MKTISVVPLLASAVLALSLWGDSAVRKSPELAFNVPGQGQKLLSQYRGKVVGLEFVLTTCSHCQEASKVMDRMQERYGSRNFRCVSRRLGFDRSNDELYGFQRPACSTAACFDRPKRHDSLSDSAIGRSGIDERGNNRQSD